MTTSAPRTPLVAVGVLLFGLGLVGLVAVFVLYASGHRDLPVWLSAGTGVVTPVGLGLALAGLVRESRRTS